MDRYISKYQESIQSEKEIHNLSTYVIRKLAERCVELIKENLFNSGKRFSVRFSFDQSSYRSNVFPEFITYLTTRWFEIFFLYDPYKKNNHNGVYIAKDHRIICYVVFPEWDKNTKKQEIEKHFMSYQSILDHEFTHAYDDFISSGRYISADYKGDGSDKYFQSNLEVNAYYSMAVNEIEEYRVYSWENYLEKFKFEFQGKWDVLSKDQQKRLIDRLYKRWQEPLKFNMDEVLSTKSYYFLNRLMNRQDYKDLEDHRMGITINKIVNYTKHTIQLMLSGKFDKNLFRSYEASKNRFYYFDTLISDAKLIETMYDKLETNLDDSTKQTVRNMIQKYENKFKTFKKFFNLSEDDFKKLMDVISKYARK